MDSKPAQKSFFSTMFMNTVIVFAALCSPGAADHVPLEEVLPLLVDTTADCQAMPEIDRALGIDTFLWGDHQYLIANLGNELAIWNIDQAQGPIPVVAESLFEVGNEGDSDHDLLAFSVCDDCRFGIANYKLGTVLFDLGENQTPTFEDSELYPDADVVPGGFTFQHGGQQFLIAADLPGECSATSSTVYSFDGILTPGLNQVTCIDAGGHSGIITAGVYFTDEADAYAYLENTTHRLLVFEIEGAPGPLNLQFQSSPSGFGTRAPNGDGFEVDAAALMAVTADMSAVTLWSLADPALPVVAGTVDTGEANPNVVALGYPRLWVSDRLSAGSSMTFDVTDPGDVQALDQGFWDPSNPWNAYACSREKAGVFSPDSSVLYMARYGTLQVISFVGIFSDDFESGATDRWSSTID